jgi:hypothetical protein
MAGAPVMLGITAQALSVRLDDHYLLVSAPQLDFLTGKPLDRLLDGNTVGYLAQLSVLTGAERTVQGRSILRFAFSYDVWSERFKVSVVTVQKPFPTSRNLTREGAQAWCLDQLKVDLSHIPTDRPIWVRLEVRSEEPAQAAGIVGEPGISISGLVELFSHPVKNQQIRKVEEVGPYNLADLRKRS